MRALTWHGAHDVRVERVPDPELLLPRDAIVRVTSTAICGSDLHLYDGFIPSMRRGDILGHEFMGEVVEVGAEVRGLAVGDRVVVPFPIACGNCWYCRNDQWALCDNSNPNAPLAELFFGESPAGIFGYSHLMGGYAGGQAEYVRVPYADVGPLKVPDGLDDERVLLLSDVLPTGWMAAENCELEGGETVAVWGCGPVGLLAVMSAYAQGAEQVVAIDSVPARLTKAAELGAVTVHHREEDVVERLRELTGGRGPDACIEAVGMESHGGGLLGPLDRVKQAVRLETGRPHALRQAIYACRKGGVLSIAGVFGGFIDTIPIGAAFNKGLTFRMGQAHVHRYLRPLLEKIRDGELRPDTILTHRMTLDEAPAAYELFRRKRDGCIKVVLSP
ncbi:MAG TPA: zinc-dependent alcohol dehydrogenase [Trueperaceae bacterium]